MDIFLYIKFIKNFMELTIKTNKKQELIDITKLVESKIKIQNGLINLYTQHTTAAIIINENYDPNVCTDILNCLSKLVPQGIWLHDKSGMCDRANAAAHIKASILGPSKTIPIKNKKLQLGQWQSIMFVELDGPRTRKIVLKQIESKE